MKNYIGVMLVYLGLMVAWIGMNNVTKQESRDEVVKGMEKLGQACKKYFEEK